MSCNEVNIRRSMRNVPCRRRIPPTWKENWCFNEKLIIRALSVMDFNVPSKLVRPVFIGIKLKLFVDRNDIFWKMIEILSKWSNWMNNLFIYWLLGSETATASSQTLLDSKQWILFIHYSLNNEFGLKWIIQDVNGDRIGVQLQIDQLSDDETKSNCQSNDK